MSQEVYYIVKKETLEELAEAIRTKEGSTDKIKVGDYAKKILNLPAAEIEYVDLTNGSFIIPEQALIESETDSTAYISNITAQNLLIGQNTSIALRPTTLFNMGIQSDKILSGTSILGVSGSATDDATAISADIRMNQKAYVKGEKITGSLYDPQAAGTGNISIEQLMLEDTGQATTLSFNHMVRGSSQILEVGTTLTFRTDELAEVLRITPEKITVGENVLETSGAGFPTGVGVVSGSTLTVTVSSEIARYFGGHPPCIVFPANTISREEARIHTVGAWLFPYVTSSLSEFMNYSTTNGSISESDDTFIYTVDLDPNGVGYNREAEYVCYFYPDGNTYGVT